MAQAEARARGYDTALLVDEEGVLVGAPHSAVAIVTDAGELVVVPGGDRAPVCLTLERLAALVPVVSFCFWGCRALFVWPPPPRPRPFDNQKNLAALPWDEEPHMNQTYHHLSPDQKK